MGVNCNVHLAVRDWQKVGQVASILLGARVHKEPLGHNGGWHAVVEGFGYGQHKPSSQPEYIYILPSFDPKNPAAKAIEKSDGLPYAMWYGLENGFLYPKCTAAKIALSEGIVKFFGGTFERNDARGSEETFPAQKWIEKEDDHCFDRYQEALMSLKPLTAADVKRCEKWAAY